MPVTPFHFGINGTVSSIAPSRIDILSCIFANILIDVQPFLVLFMGANIKQHGISHTLLVGIPACFFVFTIYGAIVRKLFHSKKPLSAYSIGGAIGGGLHIVLDSFYHNDVMPFYPFFNTNFAYLGMTNKIIPLCLLGYGTFLIALTTRFNVKRKHNKA